MIKFHTLKVTALAFFLAALLGACASSGDSPTGTAEEIQEVQSQLLGDPNLQFMRPPAEVNAHALFCGRLIVFA